MDPQMLMEAPGPIGRPQDLARRLYPPSYLDRVMDAIKRLPIPYGLLYLLFFLLESVLVHVVAWLDGWIPPFTFAPINLLYPVWTWGPLAIITYLDTVAVAALSSFRPLLPVQDEAVKRLEYEFTTMPARPVIISGMAWSIAYFIFVYLVLDDFYEAYAISPSGAAFTIVTGWIAFFAGSAIHYHSFRQLRLIHRTVQEVKAFDVFHLDPVYAFSRLTAQTGIAWVFLLSLSLLIFPIQLAALPFAVTAFFQVGLAIAAFVLPVWSVHQRLVWEKRGLLAKLNQRVQSTLARLHGSLDGDELGEVPNINSALAGLAAEREVLTKIPTWPWRVETLTGFLSALVLPILLFLLQLAIESWLVK